MISLNLIVRNCADAASRAIESVRPFLKPDDEIVIVDTGSTDDTPKRLRKYGTVIKRNLVDPSMIERMRAACPPSKSWILEHEHLKTGCISDFAAARMVAYEASAGDLIMWLDADDVLEGDLAQLRKEIDVFFANGGDAAFLRYDYSFNAEGVCNTTLWRERIVRKSNYIWKGPCHEVLVPKQQLGPCARFSSAWVRHTEARKPHEVSDLRNYAILKPLVGVGEQLEKADPRWIYYLGNACRGLEKLKEAEYYYLNFIPRSGSRDDRALAIHHCGVIALVSGRPLKALRLFQEGQLIHPDSPAMDFGMQSAYFALRRYAESVRAGQLGLAKVPAFDSLNSVDYTYFNEYPYVAMAHAAKEMKDINLMVQVLPKLPQNVAEYFARWVEAAKTCTAIHTTLARLPSDNFRLEVRSHLQLPGLSREFGLERPELPPAPKISFLCGNTFEDWGADALEVGVGGSEQMVVQMANRLAARGYDVGVYCNTGMRKSKTYNGVRWYHFLEFDPRLDRDVVIVWRSDGLARGTYKARRRFLWLHDITTQIDPLALAAVEKVLVLSPWAKSLLQGVPAQKIYLTRNGVDTPPEVEKDPYQVVYASSPDRGLDVLMRAWALLHKQGRLPERASLKILYGFTPTFYARAAAVEFAPMSERVRSMVEYAEDLLATADALPRVSFMQRVPHSVALEVIARSGVMCYPAKFDETFCIAAAEAQAAGCAVICPPRAALATTVKQPWARWLNEVTPEAVAAALVEWWNNPVTLPRCVDYGFDALVDAWCKDLLADPSAEAASGGPAV